MIKTKPWHYVDLMNEIYTRPNITTDEQVADIFRAEGHDVSRRTMADARAKFGIPAPSKGKLFEVEEPDLAPARTDKAKVWQLVTDLQQELRKENFTQRQINVNLTENKPVALAFMGDLHIGDIGTDHQALKRDADLIANTEGLFVTLGGDYINNFIKGGKKIKNHEVVPVEFAWMLMEDLFETLHESILMILSGNHDAWTDQAAEFDKLGEIVQRLGVPYGKHGANLFMKFPDGQSYKVRARHKYRFESSQNLLNAVKQMYRHDEPFDIGLLHHLHTPNYEGWMANGEMRYAVRPGSYKVEDDYSYELGYSQSGFGMSKTFGTDASCRYSVPVAIIWPGSRKIQMCSNIKDGIDMLEMARSRYE